jgi:pyroglutamyl-peptidase
MNKPWVLLTGFGSFPGVEINPTGAVCEALRGSTANKSPIQTAVFDVDFLSIENQLRKTWGDSPPAKIVLLGVAIGRTVIGIETRAVNRRQANRPDSAGFLPGENQCLRKDYPLDHTLDSQINDQTMVARLNHLQLWAESSKDAGRYLCNGVYFHALVHAAKCPTPPQCVFVHLPQVGNPKKGAVDEVWTLQDLIQATSEVLQSLSKAML